MTALEMFCKTIIFFFLMFEFSRNEAAEIGMTPWTAPLLNTGEKRLYFGLFFKANWFKAQQFCRYHGMHLVSIASQEENDKLERAITNLIGYNTELFWTSGTDYPEKGSNPKKFFWMSNGYPFTFFTNWNHEDTIEEGENCVTIGLKLLQFNTVLKWDDLSCDAEHYFICEV